MKGWGSAKERKLASNLSKAVEDNYTRASSPSTQQDDQPSMPNPNVFAEDSNSEKSTTESIEITFGSSNNKLPDIMEGKDQDGDDSSHSIDSCLL
jgi:hypothetical protein